MLKHHWIEIDVRELWLWEPCIVGNSFHWTRIVRFNVYMKFCFVVVSERISFKSKCKNRCSVYVLFWEMNAFLLMWSYSNLLGWKKSTFFLLHIACKIFKYFFIFFKCILLLNVKINGVTFNTSTILCHMHVISAKIPANINSNQVM